MKCGVDIRLLPTACSSVEGQPASEVDTNVLRPTHHVLQQKFKPSPTLIPLTLSPVAGRKHLSISSATMYNVAECQFYVLRLNVGLHTLQYILSIFKGWIIAS